MNINQFELNVNGKLDCQKLNAETIISLNPEILLEYQQEVYYDNELNEIENEYTDALGRTSFVLEQRYNSPEEVEVDLETILDIYEEYLDEIERELKFDLFYKVLDDLKKGIPFKCHFTKKDNTERELIGVFEADHNTKANLMIVYDLLNDGYRIVNINTIKDITINKKYYDFEFNID